MRKRVLSLAALLLLVFTLTAQAAETRAVTCTPILSFRGTTAICSADCWSGNSSDRLSATLTLYQGSTYVDSWSGSGTGELTLSGQHAAQSGKSYKLVLSYSVNGTSKPSVTVTNTCP